jgi:hypothetical protein
MQHVNMMIETEEPKPVQGCSVFTVSDGGIFLIAIALLDG